MNTGASVAKEPIIPWLVVPIEPGIKVVCGPVSVPLEPVISPRGFLIGLPSLALITFNSVLDCKYSLFWLGLYVLSIKLGFSVTFNDSPPVGLICSAPVAVLFNPNSPGT